MVSDIGISSFYSLDNFGSRFLCFIFGEKSPVHVCVSVTCICCIIDTTV